MKKPSRRFSKWFRSLPEDKQREIATGIAVKSGFAQSAMKIGWDPDAVKKFNEGLVFQKRREHSASQ